MRSVDFTVRRHAAAQHRPAKRPRDVLNQETHQAGYSTKLDENDDRGLSASPTLPEAKALKRHEHSGPLQRRSLQHHPVLADPSIPIQQPQPGSKRHGKQKATSLISDYSEDIGHAQLTGNTSARHSFISLLSPSPEPAMLKLEQSRFHQHASAHNESRIRNWNRTSHHSPKMGLVESKLDTADDDDLICVGSYPAVEAFEVLDFDEVDLLDGVYTFSVLAGDFDDKPISQWHALSARTSPPLSAGDFRIHVSKRMDLHRKSFIIWFGDSQEFFSPEFGGHVKIILDPFIRLRLQMSNRIERLILDFSRERLNKANMPLRFIKKKIQEALKSTLDAPQFRIFIDDRELDDDNLSLKDTGLLSLAQLDGCDEVTLDLKFNEADRSCALCADDKPLTSFPVWVTAECAHQSNTCLDCVQAWIDSKLEDGAHDKLTCPECNKPLEHMDIENLATQEQFSK